MNLDDWMLERSIDELPLGVRTYNCLKNTSILTVAELANKSTEELLKIHNLGKKGVLEIHAALAQYGLNTSCPHCGNPIRPNPLHNI